jgi:hypothetical protein
LGWKKMKKKCWNVQIELYADGSVKAAVLRAWTAEAAPQDGCVQNPGREVFSLWFESEAAARGAVVEALAMSERREAAG